MMPLKTSAVAARATVLPCLLSYFQLAVGTRELFTEEKLVSDEYADRAGVRDNAAASVDWGLNATGLPGYYRLDSSIAPNGWRSPIVTLETWRRAHADHRSNSTMDMARSLSAVVTTGGMFRDVGRADIIGAQTGIAAGRVSMSGQQHLLSGIHGDDHAVSESSLGSCIEDIDGERVGCRADCHCAWFEECYTKFAYFPGSKGKSHSDHQKQGSRDKGRANQVDVGICNPALALLVIISIMVFGSILGLVVSLRIFFQWRERLRDLDYRSYNYLAIKTGRDSQSTMRGPAGDDEDTDGDEKDEANDRTLH